MFNSRLSTAVLLAAGLGNRLRPLTNQCPKCLVEVGGKPILGHTISRLEENGFKRLVILTGYASALIEEYVAKIDTSLEIELIYNPEYAETNNIYSLWKVYPRVKEGFVLLESDLMYESAALAPFTKPDRLALDLYNETVHSGTTALVNKSNEIEQLFVKEAAPIAPIVWKTVNITSFSESTWQMVYAEIDQLMSTGNVNTFYEFALKNCIAAREVSFENVDFSQYWWDEIDTLEDLSRVESYLETGILLHPVLVNQ